MSEQNVITVEYRSPFEVELTYFKNSGKYYSRGKYTTNELILYKIWDEVHAMRIGAKLPDLIGSWNGPILIRVPHHPHDHPKLLQGLGTKAIGDIDLNPAHVASDVQWNLLQALQLVRELWPIAERCGYYIGLTGSVMIRGWSLKDLDITVYPWKVESERMSPEDLLKELGCEKFFECGKMPTELEGEVDEPPSGGSDQKSRVKSVWWSKRQGKRIDWFMLK